jgi:hypothetical protein
LNTKEETDKSGKLKHPSNKKKTEKRILNVKKMRREVHLPGREIVQSMRRKMSHNRKRDSLINEEIYIPQKEDR